MKKKFHLLWRTRFSSVGLLIIIVLLLGCAKYIKIAGTAAPTKRDQLKVETLLQGEFNSVVDKSYFMPIKAVDSKPHELSGTIYFPATRMTTSIPRDDWRGGNTILFPEFSLNFISHGSILLPTDRGIILSGERKEYKEGLEFRSIYNIIVGAGKIWKEKADAGYSRASFPFTLTENSSGQAKNGLATFVFNETKISRIAIQISQETTPWPKGRENAIALVPAAYTPHEIEEKEQIVKAYQAEINSRLPVLPWSDLPDAIALEKRFNSWVSDNELSAAALVVDGKIYQQPCRTRTGIYPYPEEMRHGVFSATKSLVAGLSMFFLAEKYGKDVFDELITDYVPIIDRNSDWQGVTFGHALNMVTGVFSYENESEVWQFLLAREAISKIKVIDKWPKSEDRPGTKFNYFSSNTFILSYALNQYVKSKEGADTNYWDMIERELLRPIGIRHFSVQSTVEREDKKGIPIACIGAYPTIDEAARIALLMQNEGRFKGRQLLNRNMVKAVLSRNDWEGYNITSCRIGTYRKWFGFDRYKHSFWTVNDYNSGSCKIDVSAMWGWGGNYVMLFPSGIIAIRFTDEGITVDGERMRHLLETAEQVRSSCP